MSRDKKAARRRILLPDQVYGSRLVTRLINRVMKDGKKSTAQTQVYQMLDLLKEKTKKEPLEVFQEALESVKPQMEVRSRRVGGAAYQVPAPVRADRREYLAIRWLVTAAQERSNKEYPHFYQKLAAEILDALQKQGAAYKKKEEVHRIADANKAFAHFRW